MRPYYEQDGISIRHEVDWLGEGVQVPKRWIGRRSKFGDHPTVRFVALERETGIHRVTLREVIEGRQQPKEETAAKLRAVGVIVPGVYDPTARVFKQITKRCAECRTRFTRACSGKWRSARFCSQTCTMRAWHRKQVKDRLCNWCGKPANGELAFVCREHDESKRRNQKRRSVISRERFKKDGTCPRCGNVRVAREGKISCSRCYEYHKAYRRMRSRAVRAERKSLGWISVPEAAAILGYRHITSLHAAIARGRLSVVGRSGKAGRRFYVSREDVERYKAWRTKDRSTPFVPVPDPDALLVSVNRLLPTGLPEDVRDDAVGAIILDLLESRTTFEALRSPVMVSSYVKEAFKWRGLYSQRSLDAPMNEDGLTLVELLGELDEDIEAIA